MMNVWILFNEEIESSSAESFEIRRLISEGKKQGINVSVYRPEQIDLIVTEDRRDSILVDGSLVPVPDFVLPRAYLRYAGYFYLAVIRHLERLGATAFNPSATIEMVEDKLHAHQILAENGIPTPATMLAKFPIDMDLVESTLGFPVVAKTLNGGNGTGVFLLKDRESFGEFANLVQETNPEIAMVFQKFVACSQGRDLRLFVVDGDVIAAMERRAADGGFKANYTQGGQVEEFIPDAEATRIALETARIFDIRLGGIDLLFTEDGGYSVCEANTFPGFKGIESCCDVNIPEKIYQAMKQRKALKEAA